MRMTIAQSIQFGLDFREYLKTTGRPTTNGKAQLKDLYNNEFRYRTESIKGPNFSSLLYALSVSHKATVCRGKVRFYSKVEPRDQWHNSHRMKQPPSFNNGHSSPGPSQQASPCPRPETQSQRRLASLLMVKLKKDKTQFVSDKNDVIISSDQEGTDRKICFSVEDDDKHIVRLHVKNAGTTAVYFTYYTMLNWLEDFTLEDEQKVTRACPLALAPGDNYEVQVLFQTSLVGFYPATLAFEFKPDLLTSSVAFHIVRYIEVHRITSLGKELAPVAPYRSSTISRLPPSSCPIVDGQRPEGQSVMRLKVEIWLENYNVPKYMNQLIDLLKNPEFRTDPRTRDRKALLGSPLTMENYCEKFQLLLYLEELQMLNDIKRYNIPNTGREYASMIKDPQNKKLLVLEVPGVAENRPSVLVGDKILVCPVGEHLEKYFGYVHAVEKESVKLGFSSKLLDRFIDGMKFSVEFTVNRLPMRLQHRATELAKKHELGVVLFPQGPPPPEAKLPLLRLFDRKLEQNPEQYRAVQHIVAGTSKPAPYLVFGPPGTGKTVTVVEAIKQIEKTKASCRILACAPSNSASDLLCKKILEHVEGRKVYRMYASTWDRKRIPLELKDCCNLVGDVYMYPLKEDLMNYTIIVTTVCTAGRLVSGGIPPGHFSHVFVDEAGHAIETECIIPLAGLLQPESGQVVLAGDPKQLGPILRSPLVQQYGLSKSLLERLMDTMPVYQKIDDDSEDEEDEDEVEEDEVEEDEVSDEGLKGTFDPRFVTKLLCNYRSHPAILKVPNDLFYDGELKVCADEILRNSYCRWEYLPKMGFPVIFHGVAGVDEQESSSPSFFNVAEVEMLMVYVRRLLENHGSKGRSKLSPKDIGIIAPYRRQVLKIRKGLQLLEKEMPHINLTKYLKVGSVEEFQGQERMVMLVSTVRSSKEYTQHDQEFTLGFIKNEKRFNVAVTRAKALLIMVGNPRVLRVDPVWNSFITYCKDNGGYTGLSYTEDDGDVARLAALWARVEPQVEKETEESVLQQQLDPEWRNEL